MCACMYAWCANMLVNTFGIVVRYWFALSGADIAHITVTLSAKE